MRSAGVKVAQAEGVGAALAALAIGLSVHLAEASGGLTSSVTRDPHTRSGPDQKFDAAIHEATCATRQFKSVRDRTNLGAFFAGRRLRRRLRLNFPGLIVASLVARRRRRVRDHFLDWSQLCRHGPPAGSITQRNVSKPTRQFNYKNWARKPPVAASSVKCIMSCLPDIMHLT